MTSAFSWQNSISLCPASFHIPRPDLTVTSGVSWLPTFAFQSPMMKRTSFLGTAAYQSPLPTRFSRQEYWSGVPLPSPSCCLKSLQPKKYVFFIIGEWNAKVGSEETPEVTGKFGLGVQNETGKGLMEFCQENALVIANTLFQQQKKTLNMDMTRWSTPKSDWLYSLQPNMEKLYTVNKNKTRGWLWLRSWTSYCQIQTEIEESRENQ